MHQKLSPSISCLIPAFNEAQNLSVLIPQILAQLLPVTSALEVIVVDDGSSDSTPEVMQKLCAQHGQIILLQLTRNFGKESAITAGLDVVQGDVVIVMDADGQHPVRLIPEMLDQWRSGFEVVYALRKNREDQSLMRSRLVKAFYKIINFRNRIPIPENAGDFRLMDKKVVQALRNLPERNRFMKGLYAWVGFNAKAVEYTPPSRTSGDTNFGIYNALSLAFRGIVAFSSIPLRALSVIGAFIALGSMAVGFWEIYQHYFGTSTPGYASIIVSITFLSGIHLIAIGVLAEYVARIYDEVKQRPIYLLRQRIGEGLSPPTGGSKT